VIKDQAGGKLKRWYRHSARSVFEPGRDEKLKLELDMQTLLYGKQQRIAINRAEPCPKCQMNQGQLRVDADQSAATWADGCEVCKGEGRINQREEISIYVPAGPDQGHKLKVNKKGSAGLNGAEDGDLILLLSPEELPRGFSRKGANLELQQAVSAQLLQSGGILPIQTLRGQVRIKVPPNFRSGGKLVIPKEGLPTWNEPDLLGSLTVCLRAMT
jgi:DnaJ-class molecular chaperone